MVKISINEHWILHLRFGKWYEALETESQIPWARRVFWTAFVSLMLLLQFAYLGEVGSSSGRWFPTFVSFVVFEIVGRLWTFLLFVIVRCPQSAVWPILIEISGELAALCCNSIVSVSIWTVCDAIMKYFYPFAQFPRNVVDGTKLMKMVNPTHLRIIIFCKFRARNDGCICVLTQNIDKYNKWQYIFTTIQ